jgi:plastocyanin
LIPTRALRSGVRIVAGAAILVASLGMAAPEVDAASTVTIRIGSTLNPAAVSVAPGNRLTWINADGDRHRVRSRTGPVEFDSGNLEPGQSFSITLRATGTYAYVDDRDRENAAYHGTVVVAAGASATAPPSGGGGGTSGGTGGGTGDSTAAPPAQASVDIGDGFFQPATITIADGGSVTWRNTDGDEHTASGRSGSFDTGILQPGSSSTKRFPTAGTFAYLCAIHPEMQGTVRVVRAGSTTLAPPAAPRPSAAPTTPPSGAGTTPGSAGTQAMRIVDFSFEPSSATVPAGTTVGWTNAGLAPHTVTAGDGSFDSGLLVAGAAWSRTFNQPGTYRFVCTFHPAMTGELIVTGLAGGGGSAPPAAPDAGNGAAPPGSSPPVGAVALGGSQPSPSQATDPAPAAATTLASSARTAPGFDAIVRAMLAVVVTVLAVLAFGRLIRGLARP